MGPCLIWMDRRAGAEIEGIDAEPGHGKGRRGARRHAYGGQDPLAEAPSWRGPQSIRRFHQPVSYVVSRLTGRAVLDHAVASTTMLYNLWDGRARPGALPAVRDRARRAAGDRSLARPWPASLSAAGAALTGLKPGIPVAVGTGDDFSNPLGAGVVRPGRVVVSLGTAEVVGAVHGTAVIDKGALVETHGYAGERFFIENPGWLSGGSLAWFIKTFRLTGVEELNELVDRRRRAPMASPSCRRSPAPWRRNGMAEARGCFYGLTAAHGPAHMARAVLEGCAFAMRDVVDRLTALGVDTSQASLLGGGAKQPRLGRDPGRAAPAGPAEVSAVADSSPLGAALLAAVAAGAAPSLDRPPTRIAPPTIDDRSRIRGNRGAYDEAYGRYRRLFTVAETPVRGRLPRMSQALMDRLLAGKAARSRRHRDAVGADPDGGDRRAVSRAAKPRFSRISAWATRLAVVSDANDPRRAGRAGGRGPRRPEHRRARAARRCPRPICETVELVRAADAACRRAWSPSAPAPSTISANTRPSSTASPMSSSARRPR